MAFTKTSCTADYSRAATKKILYSKRGLPSLKECSAGQVVHCVDVVADVVEQSECGGKPTFNKVAYGVFHIGDAALQFAKLCFRENKIIVFVGLALAADLFLRLSLSWLSGCRDVFHATVN